MSLINDALKKAQRQRGDEGAADPADASLGHSPRAGRRGRPAEGQALALKLGVGVIALCAIIVTAVFVLRTGDTPAPATPASPAQVAAATPATTTPPVVAATPAPAAPAPANPEPIAVAATPTVSAPPAAPASVPPATPTPAATTPAATSPVTFAGSTPAPAAPSSPAPASAGPISVPDLTLAPAASIPAPTGGEQDKRILAYLAQLRVTGIRPAGADSKVLMNDRVYRLNETVDFSLGLKLTGVAVQRLTFLDERGVEYVKTF